MLDKLRFNRYKIQERLGRLVRQDLRRRVQQDLILLIESVVLIEDRAVDLVEMLVQEEHNNLRNLE
jgi:hypothetical protein